MAHISRAQARIFFQLLLIFTLFPGLFSTPVFSKISTWASDLAHSSTPLKATDDLKAGEPSIEFLRGATKPMKVTCLTIGTRGDVQPFIALCQRIISLNHECTIATHETFRSFVEEHGINFRPIAGDPALLMNFSVKNGAFSPFFWIDGYKKFKPWFKDLLTSSHKAVEGSDILIENPSAMVGVHIAQSYNIPYFRAFSMPWTKTGVYPHAMFAKLAGWGSWFNKMTYIAFDRLIWVFTRGMVNHWRETELGLQRTTLSELNLSKVPFLYYFSPTIVPKARDWTGQQEVTGFWLMKPKASEEGAPPKIPDGLQEAIHTAKKNNKKIVYIGFGSVIDPNPEETTNAIIHAVQQADVFAIISGGWTVEKGKPQEATETIKFAKDVGKQTEPAQAAETSKLLDFSMKEHIARHPNDMFYVQSVPHDWLFPQIDAAFHHGGAGTTAASLIAGKPTIIKPFFGDQFFWAQRVEASGVGTHVHSLTQEEIARALMKATRDEGQMRAAAELGGKISQENGVERAIEIIEQKLRASRQWVASTRKPALPGAQVKPDGNPPPAPATQPAADDQTPDMLMKKAQLEIFRTYLSVFSLYRQKSN